MAKDMITITACILMTFVILTNPFSWSSSSTVAAAQLAGHAAAKLPDEDCNMGALITECQNYVKKAGPKVEPSPECCQAVRGADVPCACKYINKDVEMLISMEKVVFVASRCGRPLEHGTKCGSYIVPMA